MQGRRTRRPLGNMPWHVSEEDKGCILPITRAQQLGGITRTRADRALISQYGQRRRSGADSAGEQTSLLRSCRGHCGARRPPLLFRSYDGGDEGVRHDVRADHALFILNWMYKRRLHHADEALPTSDLGVPGVKSQSTSQIIPIMPPKGPCARHRHAAGTSYIKC